ncbi:hypothetical protein F4825DRAFT_431675 [Nemania diffusa]|nr:hypothetical protein F4825DRAFT_431675 [Nemania diffusa]
MGDSRLGDNQPVISPIRDASSFVKYLPSLQHLLQRCVNDDPASSSIGFIAPLSDDAALQHWLDLQPSITAPGPETTLLVATANETDTVVATVVVARAPSQSRPTHTRARSGSCSCTPDFRRAGLARAMMREAEALRARRAGARAARARHGGGVAGSAVLLEGGVDGVGCLSGLCHGCDGDEQA